MRYEEIDKTLTEQFEKYFKHKEKGYRTRLFNETKTEVISTIEYLYNNIYKKDLHLFSVTNDYILPLKYRFEGNYTELIVNFTKTGKPKLKNVNRKNTLKGKDRGNKGIILIQRDTVKKIHSLYDSNTSMIFIKSLETLNKELISKIKNTVDLRIEKVIDSY